MREREGFISSHNIVIQYSRVEYSVVQYSTVQLVQPINQEKAQKSEVRLFQHLPGHVHLVVLDVNSVLDHDDGVQID